MATAPSARNRPAITVLQKLDIVPGLLSLLATALWMTATGPFRGQQGADTFKHHVTHGVVRKMNRRLNTAQVQWIANPFRVVYENYCSAKGLKPNIVTLKSGCPAYWIGDPAAKQVVVYFHGGGFSMDAGPEGLDWWAGQVQKELADGGQSVAFLFLDYTLVPYATYPTQITEAVEVVQYLIHEEKRSPSSISLAGDSAGGSMSLAVLSHILHPHPDVPKLEIDQPLKSLVLVAPWVSFRTDFPSSKSNSYKDIVTGYVGKVWSGDYLGGKPSSEYAEALRADADWWKDAPQKVQQMLCVAGSDELLIDPINEWVEKYKSVVPGDHLQYVVGRNEIHIAPIIEPLLGDPTPTEQGNAIKAFLKARL